METKLTTSLITAFNNAFGASILGPEDVGHRLEVEASGISIISQNNGFNVGGRRIEMYRNGSLQVLGPLSQRWHYIPPATAEKMITTLLEGGDAVFSLMAVGS